MVDLDRDIEHLQAELRRQQQHTTLLREVALASRGAVEPQQVFHAIYNRLIALLPIDAFFVALCEHEGAPEYRIAYMIDEGQFYELSDLRVGGLTGYLLQHKQPLLFRDLHSEYYQRALPPPEKYGRVEKLSKAWMGVPIVIGREAVGVLSAQSYDYGVYDENDLQLLTALGDLAAIAIENAMLYQAQDELSQSLAARVTARSEELAVLTAIAISFSQGQSLPVLLDEVLERVLWLLGMSAGSIFLHERRTLMSRTGWRADVEMPAPPEWLPLDGHSREAIALRTGQLSEVSEGEQTVLTMPLRAHGQTIGTMTLYGPVRPLTEHERTLLEAASYQIAIGIENARLLAERERQIARLEALNNIAAASSATLDLRPMLRKVADILQHLLPIDGLLATSYDAQHQAITTGITWSGETGQQSIDRRALNPNTRVALVLRRLEPVLLRHTDPLHIQIQPQQAWEHGTLSWLGVPLLSRDNRPIGVLAVQSQRPDAFEQRDLRFLEAVAHQLALDVENAQLYQAARTSAEIAEQRAENLTLVHNISRLVNSSLNPQTVLGIAAEELVKLFDIDHCAINIYGSSGWIGEVVAEYPALGSLGQHVSFENVEDFRGDMQYVGQPIYIADTANDPRVAPITHLTQQLEISAMLIVPLISRGRAIGAIGLNSRTLSREYTPEDLELCRTIAAQVAIALENARLFQLSVTRIEQEMEIARSIQANLFPRSLPEIPCARLAARCIPARETGGDFYDVLPLGDDRFGLSVGDVSGKSLPAAMLMAVARSIVRSEALDHTLPEEVMCQTNILIAQDVLPDTYVALCYAVYDAGRRTLDLALGGQLTPMIRYRDGSVEFIEATGNFPLGIVPTVEYTATSVQLAQGDSVLLYTDGLVEAFSPGHELFGFDRLAAAFAECGDAPAAEVVDRLLTTIDEWQGGLDRHDDVTAVVLQIV